MNNRAEIVVSGKVQRVGYRDAVEKMARELNITGFVENIKPYDVRIVAEGEKENIEEFIEKIKIHEFPISVEHIGVMFEETTSEFEYFMTKRGDWHEELGERLDAAGNILYEQLQQTNAIRDALDQYQQQVTGIKDEFKKIEKQQIEVAAKPICSILGLPKCSQQIELKQNEVFVAHPFRDFTVKDFRTALESVLKLKQFNLKPTYADEKLLSGHILCKICREIQSTKFGIYDISTWNPNVTLELGLSYGLKKPALLLIDKRLKKGIPADLGGLDRIEYEGIEDLKDKLNKKLSAFINEMS